MIRRGEAIVLAALLLAAAAGCQGSANPPIFLGHVANLSGADRSGLHAEQGIRLALKLLTDDNLTEALGRELKVRHTDTRGVLDASEAEAVRLAAVNRVVGIMGGASAEEVARLDRAHVPVLAQTGVRPPGASDLVFAVGMRRSQQAAILAQYAADELDLGEIVAVADERRDDFLAVADAFGRRFALERRAQGKGSGPPHAVIRFGKDAKWEEIAKTLAARKSVKAVLFAGSARDWVELRGKMAWSPSLIFAGEDGDAPNLHDAPGKQTVYLASAFAPDRDAPRVQAFIEKYREAFKEEPDVAAALAYESLQVFADALKRAGPLLTGEKLRDALRDALRELKDFDGLAGPLTMTADQYVRRPLYVGRLEGGAVVPLKRYEGAALP